MTSLYPNEHRVAVDSPHPLHPARITFAEQLAAHGYRSAAFTDGGWTRGKFGFSQGFEVYDDTGGGLKEILPKAEAWISEQDERPFFLFLHSYDVHSATERLPYDCPGDSSGLYADEYEVDFDGCHDDRCASQLLRWANEAILESGWDRHEVFSDEVVGYMKALYDGCIHYADGKVGAFIDRLRQLGLYDNTLLVVVSDHGEEFFEHGFLLHRRGVYEEVARIPLLMKFPESRWAGHRMSGLASMVDVMPTALSALGYPVNEQASGRSLLALVESGHPVRDAAFFASAVRTERWKYISGAHELYDLESDPGETINLTQERPEIVERLARLQRDELRRQLAAYEAFVAEFGAEDRPVEITEQDAARLRALGYIQ